MAEITEPVLKKPKMEETIDEFIDNIMNSKKNLQAVVSDEYVKPIAFTKVYIGQVKDVQELSKIISILNEKLPLKELQHLKRARKKEVILCPTSFLTMSTKESIQVYIDENLEELTESFDYFKVIPVPSMPAKLKKQHSECARLWSCNFHPNKYLEKLCSDQFFSADDLKLHRGYMGVAFEIARFYLSEMNCNLQLTDIILRNINATVVVDPFNNSIVAVSFDNRENHPIQHSAMLAIDNVAKTQNGGAWDKAEKFEGVSLSGIDKELLVHLKIKYPYLKFGARSYVSKVFMEENCISFATSPYLCTGYCVYLIREPCVMCSMGLVHARANRVFYCLKNHLHGALGSKTKLQCVPSLNHHFEVFTDFL